MTYLVDSDWVADYLKGRAVALTLLDTLVLDGMAISIVTYAEVLEGIYYGHEPTHHEHAFRQFVHAVRVLGVTRAVARRYAHISGRLRAQGLLIPPPDLFIAATAVEHDLVLVTRNHRHFARIPGLELYTE